MDDFLVFPAFLHKMISSDDGTHDRQNLQSDYQDLTHEERRYDTRINRGPKLDHTNNLGQEPTVENPEPSSPQHVYECDPSHNSEKQGLSSSADSHQRLSTSGCQADEQTENLSAAVLAHIERNRQRALLLRQAHLAKQPLPHSDGKCNTKRGGRALDTGGGFLLEEGEDEGEGACKIRKVVENPAPVVQDEYVLCEECGKPFMDSFLSSNFDLTICDRCRDVEGQHGLMTRTEAKSEFLLKDCDLDLREPSLRYITRKNPQHSHWSEMKLYLRLQVEMRSLEVWGNEVKREEEKERRQGHRKHIQQKRFDKKIKELRLSVRSSMTQRSSAVHKHEFGPEEYDAGSDEYRKTCSSCGHCLVYEKM
uniref:XPA, DNA damage recognition and repair factor n=1 Tax=Eptatretus burgeri TaxID=7764 RepID=A0A8C4QJE7_EPTBU